MWGKDDDDNDSNDYDYDDNKNYICLVVWVLLSVLIFIVCKIFSFLFGVFSCVCYIVYEIFNSL